MHECGTKDNPLTISELNFSFHTIEFTLKLAASDYQKVLHILLRTNCKTWYAEYGSTLFWYSNIMRDKGVSVRLMSTSNLGPDLSLCYHSISLRVNPRILLGDTSYLGIYINTPEENARLISTLNRCLDAVGLKEFFSYDLGYNLPCTIENFTISRVDLCVNYKFDSDFIASSYLKLMRRGNRHQFLKETVKYDPAARRKIPYKNALSLAARSFDIVVYNKAAQMEDNLDFFQSVPAEADGILRFEIQLRREKLRRILDGLPDTGLYYILSYLPVLCRAEFARYAKALFCTGGYYTLQAAKSIINTLENPSSSHKKAQFIEAVSTNKSLYKTIREYEHKGKSCRYLLDGLSKLGINPVTIPERWFGPIAYLDSIPNRLGFCPPTDPEQIQARLCG